VFLLSDGLKPQTDQRTRLMFNDVAPFAPPLPLPQAFQIKQATGSKPYDVILLSDDLPLEDLKEIERAFCGPDR
jgi:hypothetical protein